MEDGRALAEGDEAPRQLADVRSHHTECDCLNINPSALHGAREVNHWHHVAWVNGIGDLLDNRVNSCLDLGHHVVPLSREHGALSRREGTETLLDMHVDGACELAEVQLEALELALKNGLHEVRARLDAVSVSRAVARIQLSLGQGNALLLVQQRKAVLSEEARRSAVHRDGGPVTLDGTRCVAGRHHLLTNTEALSECGDDVAEALLHEVDILAVSRRERVVNEHLANHLILLALTRNVLGSKAQLLTLDECLHLLNLHRLELVVERNCLLLSHDRELLAEHLEAVGVEVLGVGRECGVNHTLTRDALGLEGEDQLVKVTKVAIVDDHGNKGLRRLGKDSVRLLKEVVEEQALLLALPAQVAQVEAIAEHQTPVSCLLLEGQGTSTRDESLERAVKLSYNPCGKHELLRIRSKMPTLSLLSWCKMPSLRANHCMVQLHKCS